MLAFSASILKGAKLEKAGHADHIRRVTIWLRKQWRGFTLVELMVAIAIVGTVAGIAIPTYTDWVRRARNTKAIAEIGILEREIAAYETKYMSLPQTLNDIGRGNLQDPWGNLYQYFNITTATGKGKMRKDRWLVPINTDYDLYSMGQDGKSVSPLTAQASHDDIIRANDGRYIGLASEY